VARERTSAARYPTRTSLTLLERLKSRDPEALGDVARLYAEPLRRSVQRALDLTRADAEEAVQEAMALFVRDPAKLAGFVPSESGARFRSYLFTFVANIARNHRRKKRPEPLGDDAESPELDEEIRRDQARRTLRFLMQAAEDEHPQRRPRRECALALLAYYEHGSTYRGIAERLGTTVERVKYLLEAGRKLAREAARRCVMEDALAQDDFEAQYAAFVARLDELLAQAARA
jgi:RNA polymerase sigma factor (sigma-70 family)